MECCKLGGEYVYFDLESNDQGFVAYLSHEKGSLEEKSFRTIKNRARMNAGVIQW